MEIPGLGSVPLHKRARVLALVALASFACGGSSGSTSSGGGAPYVVGITTDLTQATSAAGVPLRDGITTYFKFVNAHGGINGHKVQVIALDDQSKPDLGIANLKQLAQQYHAVAVTGFSTSSVQGALYPYLDQYQAIVVGKDTVSTDVSGPKMIRWVYQASIVNALGVTAQVDYAITLNKGQPHQAGHSLRGHRRRAGEPFAC
jgi:branched-chain amino acid transport system substrate-binding protein